MTPKEQFLSKRQRYQPISLPQQFSDEEMVRDWTLSASDTQEIEKYRKNFRLFVAIQLCSVRLYGRFLNQVHDLSPHIINYLGQQLDLPPSLAVEVPERKATYTDHRQNIMTYLGFQRFDDQAQQQLETWIEQQAQLGTLPDELFERAEIHLLDQHILLPGPSVLERMIVHVCADVHLELFEAVFERLSPELRQAIDHLLTVPDGQQRSTFYHLKDFPPAPSISSIQSYLQHYQTVAGTGISELELQVLTPEFLDYLFKQAKRYSAKDLKRFADHKRYTFMIAFLLETRKTLLDHLVEMHDQYVMDISRKSRNAYEQKHRELRKRQKRAIDVMLDTTDFLLDWPDEQLISKADLWQQVEEVNLRRSRKDLQEFKQLEERGYGDLLLKRYPSLRKYFADFIHLPFAAKPGSEHLSQAIDLVRQLDAGTLKRLPTTAPTDFVPKELRRALSDAADTLNRNAWEMGLALAMKDALRSGDLYLPQSKQHVSFWDLTLHESRWQEVKETAFDDLQQPQKHEAKAVITGQFHEACDLAKKRFAVDDFAEIEDGKLKLKRYDKIALPPGITTLQKVIDARMPLIRIEQLLMEVDQLTGFSRHFTSIHGSRSRPPQFYKTLMATLISQATNLGVVSMSASVTGITVDMLRHVLHDFVREETLMAANAEIVNRHHQLPLSAVHGTGTLSSSDAQRFGIRASSLLASYYPRYYGYYDKAIGIYTHISDQYAVYSTKVISCSPREALYVLDGLLENNTILKIREHTTDTHG